MNKNLLAKKLIELQSKYNTIQDSITAYDVIQTDKIVPFAKFLMSDEYAANIEQIHHNIDEFVTKDTGKFKCILGFRGSLKSTLFNRYNVVKQIIKNPAIRVLEFAAKQDLAAGHLFAIKQIFETNRKLRTYYGEFKGKVWSSEHILVKPAEYIDNPDNTYTVETAGADTKIASKHYDLIVVDDPIGREHVENSAEMDKVVNAFKLLVPLLTPKGKIIVLLMRWGKNDFYDRCIRDNPSFETFILPDVKRNEHGQPVSRSGIVISEQSPKRVPNLPKLYPIHKLDSIRATIGDYLYSCHYAQYPDTGKTKKLLRPERLVMIPEPEVTDLRKKVTLHEIDHSNIRLAIDLTNSDTDQSNSVSIELWYYHNKHFYLLDYIKLKSDWNYVITMLIQQFILKYTLNEVYIEASGAHTNFELLLREQLRNVGRENLMIHDISHEGRNKKLRILSIQPLLDTGRIHVPDKGVCMYPMSPDNQPRDMLLELQTEMNLFPRDATNIPDDLIDIFGFLPQLFDTELLYGNPELLQQSTADNDKIDDRLEDQYIVSDDETVVFL